MIERRVPCPKCAAPVIEGAKKCRACKAWLVAPPEPVRTQSAIPRIAIVLGSAVATLMIVLISGTESKVGEAPPLTNLTPDSSAGAVAPGPAAIGPDPGPEKKPTLSTDPDRTWRVRQFKIGDDRPLDIVFHPSGNSIYVSCDDATLREYKLSTGEILHQAQMPAQGDHIRLLFNRYVAVLRHQDAARIPVMDTTAWDRDPMLLDVGTSPRDIVELPDGKTVVTATTDSKLVARFDLSTGNRLSDIRLPHSTGQVFLVQAEGRPYVAAIGALEHAGRQAGSWIDLFDPSEQPFGATRRSIPIGRELGEGDVSSDRTMLLFPDLAGSSARLLHVSSMTAASEVMVGAGPSTGFIFGADKYGITLNTTAKTATVINLAGMEVTDTLMLNGVPRSGTLSPDRKMLFVSMGGDTYPPAGASVTVIADDPPRVVTSLATGRGATQIAVSPDGTRAAVACWSDKSITIFEQQSPQAAAPTP
ncbi:MAG: hypothetical protein IPK82_07755 [Polyangiaceae bacterium]|nr:hypothetical protein [Polyangiaceae bacterium]